MKKIITSLLMLAAINCTAQDFAPSIDIDGFFFTPNETKDFVIYIQELGNLPSNGNLTFRVVQPSGLNITWSTQNGTASVAGGTSTNNGVWTFSKSGNIITCTTSSIIPAYGFSVIGFTATRKVGIAANTTMTITTVITKNSGGDTNTQNNVTGLQTIAQ